MKTYTFSIGAGATVDVAVIGRYMRVISAGSPATFGFWSRGSLKSECEALSAGFWARPDEAFDRITITSAAAQDVTLLIGAGDAGYDVVSLSGGSVDATNVQGGTISDPAAVAVGTSATLLLAASATRKSARFLNSGTAPVYIGSSSVTVADGAVSIDPGMMWVERDAAAAAWYAISGTAGQSVKVQAVS